MMPQDIREFSHTLGKGHRTGPEDFKDPVSKLGLGQYRDCNVCNVIHINKGLNRVARRQRQINCQYFVQHKALTEILEKPAGSDSVPWEAA